MADNAILENADAKVSEGPGRTVIVCAWCDGWKELTARYSKAGYAVSHGLCRKCEKDPKKGWRS